MTVTENPFLTGNYGPVDKEVTATDLVVEGTIPAELQGRYLRTGPNPYRMPEGPYHWFVGDGMMHGDRARWGRAPVPQPLGPHRGDRASDRRTTGRGPPAADVRREQHQRARLTRAASSRYRRRDALRAVAASSTRCVARLRRPAPERIHRASEDRSGHRRAAAFSYWFAELHLIYHLIDADGRSFAANRSRASR